VKDFSIDDEGDDLHGDSGLNQGTIDPRIIVPPNAEQAHIGVYF
jgi:hypothetical protein